MLATVGDIEIISGDFVERGPHSVVLDDGATSDIFSGSSYDPDDTTGDDQPCTKTRENTYVVQDEGDGYGLLRVVVNDANYDTTLNCLTILDEINDRDSDGLNAAQEATIGTDPDVPDTDGDGLNDGFELYFRMENPLYDGDVSSESGFDEGNPNVWDKLEMKIEIGYDSEKGVGNQFLWLDPLDTDSDDDGVTDGEDGTGDSDGDGLPNCLDPDSDNDGLRDGTEMGIFYANVPPGQYYSGTDELPNGEIATRDVSGTNTEDWFSATDQTQAFYDGVYYIDEYEVPNHYYDYPNFREDEYPDTTTDPNRRDSDGDYVPDGTFCVPFAGSVKMYAGEDRNNNGDNDDDVIVKATIMGCDQPTNCDPEETDPNDPADVPCDSLQDSDCDGLADVIELNTGSDEFDKDTDDDGLLDGDEYYGTGQNERWFGVKTDPCHPDTDRDGLPDGLELGITDKIYDYDPINPQVGQFGGTSYDAESEEDKYFFTTVAPYGESRKVRRFISDGAPDSRSDPSHRDTNRDGELDSESDIDSNGIIDTGKEDPSLGLFVHPNEPWNYDEEGILYLPTIPNEGAFVLEPLGDGTYLSNTLTVFVKYQDNPGNLMSSNPSAVLVERISVENLPPQIEAYTLTTHNSSSNVVGLSYASSSASGYPSTSLVPVPDELEFGPRYGGKWPPLFEYSDDPYIPGPDIDHVEPWLNVDLFSWSFAGGLKNFGSFNQNIVFDFLIGMVAVRVYQILAQTRFSFRFKCRT